MSGSRIIIADEDRLDNVHPGDILRHDFLIGSKIPVREVAAGAGVDENVLTEIMNRQRPVDANTGIRLARYFNMSESFFVGVQIDYDLEEEWRAHGAELDRIVSRAA